jgi:hypothetical protein
MGFTCHPWRGHVGDAEEVNEEVLFLDDQDEEVDTTEIIDADIEKEDT